MKLYKILFFLTFCGSTLSFLTLKRDEPLTFNASNTENKKSVGERIEVPMVNASINGEMDPRFNFKTQVVLYDHCDYKGSYVTCSNLEDYSHCNLAANFNDRVSSYRITQGTCFMMYDHNPPGGESFYADQDRSCSAFSDRMSSIKTCGLSQRSSQCPSGSFVKRVRWSVNDALKSGIDMYCYKPENKTSTTAILKTHYSSFTGGDKMCTGIRGILNYRQHKMQIYHNIEPICSPDQSTPDKFMCKAKEAISGISVTVEGITNYIKRMSYTCTNVGDIEKICAAEDEIQTLFTCDATGAVAPLKCTWQKKVGYGTKSSMSESESNSRTFYSEYGFEMGAAGFGLSANFKATIGESLTTGYNWIKTQESTWSQEVTFTIEIEAPPKCKTVVSEIYGKCSFMAVRPYHFTRNDTCISKTNGVSENFITQEIIPHDIQEGSIFISKIPDKIFRFNKDDFATPIFDD